MPGLPRGLRLLNRDVSSVDDAREVIGKWVAAKARAEASPMRALQEAENPRLRRVLEQITGYRRDLTPTGEGAALDVERARAVQEEAELLGPIFEMAPSGVVEEGYHLAMADQLYGEAAEAMEAGLDWQAKVALLEGRMAQLTGRAAKRNGGQLYQEYLQEFNKVRARKGLSAVTADAIGANWNPQAPLWAEGWDVAGSPEAKKATWSALLGLHKSSLATDPFMPEFFKFYDRFLNYWKAQAVTSTGFILRNLLGGTWINMAIAGVDPGTTRKFAAIYWSAFHTGEGDTLLGVRRLLSEMIDAKAPTTRLPGVPKRLKFTKDRSLPLSDSMNFGIKTVDFDDLKTAERIFEGGYFSGGQVITEVERGVAKRAKLTAINPLTGGDMDVVFNPFSSEFAPFRAIRTANEQAEVVLRGTLAFDILKKGGTPADALDAVHTFHFNYADLAKGERIARRVIPFWKWQKSVIPLMVESVGRNPTAWDRLYQIKGELELHSKEEGVVPDYFLENMGIRLPWKINGYQSYAVPDMPFRDLNRLLKEPTSLTRMVAESSAPPVKSMLEMWAGKQFFADIPFTGRFQQVPPTYSNIPFLMDALKFAGKAKRNQRGEWRMRDNDLYLMDSWMPFMGRLRRMFPNEARYQRRVISTTLSTVFGTAVRINDQFEKRNQEIRNDRAFDEEWRELLDLEWRTR